MSRSFPKISHVRMHHKLASRVLKIILVAVVAAVVSGIFLEKCFFERKQIPWLFKGAYTTYEGTIEFSYYSLQVTVRNKLVGYNSSHAELITYIRAESPFTGVTGGQNTTWVDLRNNNYEFEGATFERKYEDNVRCDGLGTRNCTIYKYRDVTTVDCFLILRYIIFYVDMQIGWPVKMGLRTLRHSVDLDIAETNIPSLLSAPIACMVICAF